VALRLISKNRKLFEHFVILELVAYIGYTHNPNKLDYWRTRDGVKVNAVIGNDLIGGGRQAVEIK